MSTIAPASMDQMEFNGPTWKVLKLWLEEKKRNKVELLVGADTHDKSNKIRGAIQAIDEILALEKAANIRR